MDRRNRAAHLVPVRSNPPEELNLGGWVRNAVDEILRTDRGPVFALDDIRRSSVTYSECALTIRLPLKWESKSPLEEYSKTPLMRNRRLFIVGDAVDDENGHFSIRS